MAHLSLVPLANIALPDMPEYVLLEVLPGEPLSNGPVGFGKPLMACQW